MLGVGISIKNVTTTRRQVSAQTIKAPRLVSSATLTPPRVNRGARTLSAPLLNSRATLPPPVLRRGSLTAPLLTNSSQRFSPSVQRGPVTLRPVRIANTAVALAPVVQAGGVTVVPPSINDNDTFFAPSVGRGARSVSPPLLVNTSILRVPTITTGARTLYPTSLNNNAQVSVPTVGRGARALSAPLLTNTTVLRPPAANRGPVTLSAPAINSQAQTQSPTVQRGSRTLSPPVVDAMAVVLSPSVSSRKTLSAPLIVNAQAFYSPTVSVTQTAVYSSPNARMVSEGDSLTAGGDGFGVSWLPYMTFFAGGRGFQPRGYNQAASGDSASNMASTSSLAGVNNLLPKLVTFLAGTNDLASGATAAAVYANLKTCVKSYIDNGSLTVVWIKLLPRAINANWTSAMETQRQNLNMLIGGFASDADLSAYKSKIRVVDAESAMTGSANRIADGLHSSHIGAVVLANVVAVTVNQLFGSTPKLSDLYLDASNLLPNAALAGTGGATYSSNGGSITGQVASSWNVNETGGMQVVNSKTTLNGATAQRIQVSGTNKQDAANVQFLARITASGAAADDYEACVDFKLAAGHTNIRWLSGNVETGSQTGNLFANYLMDGAGEITGTMRVPISAASNQNPAPYVTFQVVFRNGSVGADITFSKPYARKVPAGQ